MPEVPIAWQCSVDVLRRPEVSGGCLYIGRRQIKWISRVRAECLATPLRRFRRGLVDSPACPCCGEAEKDDVHVLVGCPATRTADWLALLFEAWGAAADAASLPGLKVPMDWLKEHRLQLMAALIPESFFFCCACYKCFGAGTAAAFGFGSSDS